MHPFHLPDPEKLGFYGKPRDITDLSKHSTSAFIPEAIHLPPIRQDPSECYALRKMAKPRRLSTSSASSSSQSNYHLSRSTSPATSSYSVDFPHDHTITHHRLSMQNGHGRYSPYSTPRGLTNQCPSCLERGCAVLVPLGGQCSQCGTLAPDRKQSLSTKTPHKKRHDRVRFSRQTSFTISPSQIAKSDREAGRRYDQTLVFSLLENELLSLNPSLPQTARPRQSHPQGGLKELRGNNVSGDIKKYSNVEPLRYGKIDNLEAAVWVIRDSTAVIDDVIRERAGLRDDAERLFREGADIEQVKRFVLDRIVQDDWVERIGESKGTRGGCDWAIPSQM